MVGDNDAFVFWVWFTLTAVDCGTHRSCGVFLEPGIFYDWEHVSCLCTMFHVMGSSIRSGSHSLVFLDEE